MAKREVSEQKANLYLLAIVAIVAVVGIVVLVLNSGGVSVSTDDLSGQATAAKTAKALALTKATVKTATTGLAASSAECRDITSYDCDGTWSYQSDQGSCVCIVDGIATASVTRGTSGVDSACPTCPEHCTCMESDSGACIQLCDE